VAVSDWLKGNLTLTSLDSLSLLIQSHDEETILDELDFTGLITCLLEHLNKVRLFTDRLLSISWPVIGQI